MRKGKLSNEELSDCVFSAIGKRRAEIDVASGLSEDCASFACDGTLLITTDPITATDESSGRLAIIINCNDVYAAGGEPFLAMLTVLIPTGGDVSAVKRIVAEAEAACVENNLQIAGGHTEFTDAVNRPVVSATVVGRAKRRIRATTARVGDDIVISKSVGLEGSYILVKENEKKVRAEFGDAFADEVLSYAEKLSLRKESAVALCNGVRTMHDVTEGGVFGAVSEMATAAGVGAELFLEDVPMTNETRKLCSFFKIDPYRLISGGSMLMAAENGEKLVSALVGSGVPASVIGRFTDGTEQIAYNGQITEELSVTSDALFDKTE